jgi:hypothetical protein
LSLGGFIDLIFTGSSAPLKYITCPVDGGLKVFWNLTNRIPKTENNTTPLNETNDTIQETYCCLPPDILYGCTNTVILDNIFANTNIIGVIPRNLTKKIKNCTIPNIFRNVNIMPNLEYYYDKNGGLNDSILNKVEIEGELDGDESEYTVVFRNEFGMLKKRKSVDSDRSLGQFVYVPNNFTASGSLMNVFNFRYNLPAHWEMPSKFTNESGIVIESYKSTHHLETAITNGEFDVYRLPYRTQYYFTTDKSVKWDSIYDAKSVFITNEQDVDFSNKNTMGYSRQYYDDNTEVSIVKKYVWTNDKNVSTPIDWANNVIEIFNVDLNLCGKKNENNMIVDNGCPIIIDKKRVHLDNFISGIITIFLNGRVFSENFAVDQLTTTNHKASGSSSIIDYYGFGKNIILPYFRSYPLDNSLIFIPIDDNCVYCDFMVNCEEGTINKYYTHFGEGNLKVNYLFNTKYDKYVFKQ